jgi:hypothetical protein
VPELDILEMIEKMGNPSKDEGDWIAKIDLVESGKALKLEEQEQLGKCGAECRTVQKAVQEILDEHDTDIAEKLWQVRFSSAIVCACGSPVMIHMPPWIWKRA